MTSTPAQGQGLVDGREPEGGGVEGAAEGIGAGEAPAPVVPARKGRRKRTLLDRVDAYVSKLSMRSQFWHRVCSMIWLPYAFRSGIQMKQVDENTYWAVLPFKRFNRNWYNAMAGAALLGNSEIAGGTYVFKACGGEYTVVCKNLEYKFLRPCYGPAVYRIMPRENLKELIASGSEFNVTLDLEIVQTGMLPRGVQKAADKVTPKMGEKTKEKRVGRCVAVFHVTPKVHQQEKGRPVRRIV